MVNFLYVKQQNFVPQVQTLNFAWVIEEFDETVLKINGRKEAIKYSQIDFYSAARCLDSRPLFVLPCQKRA